MKFPFLSLFARPRKKLITKWAVLFLASLSVLYFIILQSSTPNETNHKSEVDKEFEEILRRTPYLWRKLDLGENETVASRVVAQQQWITKISETRYIKEMKNLKTILVEDDISLFYKTKSRINCPYALSFEDRCKLEQMSFLRRNMLKVKYFGVKADIVLSVRNWDSRFTFKTPSNLMQLFYIMEPPSIAKDAYLGYNNALLASYWKGSDIPVPYQMWKLNNQSEQISLNDNDMLKTKTKLAAAIVSNCDGIHRLEYIRELQKYMQIDVYGKCGTFSCAKENNAHCLELMGKEYKFFLAFENSKCEDYITEKLFENALKHNMLPVVMGAKPLDYETAAPPNSYINVDDFDSPEKLAEYLLKISQDEELYKSYFEWKGKGETTTEPMSDLFCRVCGMLYYADFVPPPSWDSPEVTWKDVNKCISGDNWYKTI